MIYDTTEFKYIVLAACDGNSRDPSKTEILMILRRRARLDLSPCHRQADIFFAIDERGFTNVGDDKSHSISMTII
jgi:hypothetical protein